MKKLIPLLGLFLMVAVLFQACSDPPANASNETEIQEKNQEDTATQILVFKEVGCVEVDSKWFKVVRTESANPVLIPCDEFVKDGLGSVIANLNRRPREGISSDGYATQVKFYETNDDSQEDATLTDAENKDVGWRDWLKGNWLALIGGALAFIELIVQLTPTEKDNGWFKWLKKLLNGIVPNNKAGGGTHSVE